MLGDCPAGLGNWPRRFRGPSSVRNRAKATVNFFACIYFKWILFSIPRTIVFKTILYVLSLTGPKKKKMIYIVKKIDYTFILFP